MHYKQGFPRLSTDQRSRKKQGRVDITMSGRNNIPRVECEASYSMVGNRLCFDIFHSAVIAISVKIHKYLIEDFRKEQTSTALYSLRVSLEREGSHQAKEWVPYRSLLVGSIPCLLNQYAGDVIVKDELTDNLGLQYSRKTWLIIAVFCTEFLYEEWSNFEHLHSMSFHFLETCKKLTLTHSPLR